MKTSHKYVLTLAAAMLALPGCVDDAYDLDNINTDVEVKINNLTIPVNLDTIELSSAFDLDDDSAVKEVNGEYAVVVDGDFNSDPTNIPQITVNTNANIQPIVCQIAKYDGTLTGGIAFPVSGQAISYEITPQQTDFSFKATDVDNAIRDIYTIKGSWAINVSMALADDNGLINTLQFKDLVLQLPAGLHVTNSDYTCRDNGEVVVGNLKIDANNTKQIQLNIDEIDCRKLKAAGIMTFTATTGKGTIDLNGRVGVKSGFVVGGTNATTTAVPQNVTLRIQPAMGAITVNAVSGKIAYDIDGFNVEDVSLDDLPDMLRQDGTKIRLANPQLYLSLNNPVAGYGLQAETGLSLTPVRGTVNGTKASLDGDPIRLTADKGVAGPYNFCIAPVDPKTYWQGYQAPSFVGFSALSDLLWGDGLPDRIKVDFISPRVLPGDVTDFRLGGTDANPTIGAVQGKYTLYAPLALGAGSQVVYEEQETGWNDDDLAKVKITAFGLTATIYNSLPVSIELSGTPLDADGRQLKDNQGNPVKLKGFVVESGKEVPVTMSLDLKAGNYIKGIDGLRYTATCKVTDANRVLKPTETITIKDIRVTVGGSYTDTL